MSRTRPAKAALDAAEVELLGAIEADRSDGVTWGDLSEALGLDTRGGALRFAKRLRERLTNP